MGSEQRRNSIVCCCDSSYAPHLAVSLTTLAEHNNACLYDIYVLSSDVRARPIKRLRACLSGLGFNVHFLQVDASAFEGYPVSGHISMAAYYRLLIPDELPQHLSRVLYLDCDTCITSSIESLFDVDISRHALAAVKSSDNPEFDRNRLSIPSPHKYFNSGVMLMNLEYLRSANLLTCSRDFVVANKDLILWWDQDVLNGLFYDQWLELDMTWNFTHSHSFLARHGLCLTYVNPRGETQNDIIKVIHFTGGGFSKPWNIHCKSPFTSIYREALAKTSFRGLRLEGSPSIFTRIVNKLRRLFVSRKG